MSDELDSNRKCHIWTNMNELNCTKRAHPKKKRKKEKGKIHQRKDFSERFSGVCSEQMFLGISTLSLLLGMAFSRGILVFVLLRGLVL